MLVICENDGPVAHVRLNRPSKKNALSFELLDELKSSLDKIDEDPDVRLVVLSGMGAAFSVGFDVMAMSSVIGHDGLPDSVALRRMATSGEELLTRLQAMKAITVCKAHGFAMGGGFLFFMACDFRICTKEMIFSMPEVKLGLPLIWGGAPMLIRELGRGLTREILMTGNSFGPDRLAPMGAIHDIAEAEDLDSVCDHWVNQLLERPSTALRLLKEQMSPFGSPSDEAELLIQAVSNPHFMGDAMRYIQSLKTKSE